jgi:hypothetical protein
MHILHINSEKDVGKVDEFVEQGKDVFIIVYMEGCGPCNATRPEWAKMETALKEQYSKNDKLVIIDVNKDYLSGIKSIGNVDGFPTIKYICKSGTIVDPYEGERSVSSFISWIESKINNVISTTPTSSPENVYKRLVKHTTRSRSRTRRRHNKNKTRYNKNKTKMRGGKWSKKYKASINCSKPKGFSQKQHCKYGCNK